MTDYVLNSKSEPSNGELVWAFDLGKGSIGEAVRRGTNFLHKASLLIPPDFAETRTAANRRRMFRTRKAHKAREQWLRDVMQQAGIEILHGRRVGKKVNGQWVQISSGDPRLEREFAASGDNTCYTSCLLRIKLLRGEKLEPWQIFKAFHSAIQRRGYGKVAWASRDQKRQGKSEEQLESALAKKDPAYRAAVEAWPKFKQDIPDERYHYPAYYDAAKMGLWKPDSPDVFLEKTNHQAQSTRNVRFHRTDLEREILLLATNADKLLDGKLEKARIALLEKFKREQLDRVNLINRRRSAKNATIPADKHKQPLPQPNFEQLAASAGEFILYGPSGIPYASYYPHLRWQLGLRQGGENDWQGVLGQKIPRFDNRIVNTCALLPRFQVCAVHFRFDAQGLPRSESLLHSEFAFLWKLKNLKFTRGGNEDQLTPVELKNVFDFPDPSCFRVDTKTWSKLSKQFRWDDSALPKPIKPTKGKPQNRQELTTWFMRQLNGVQILGDSGMVEKLKPEEIASITSEVLIRSYELTESRLAACLAEIGGNPLPSQNTIEPPKPTGRSRFSRPALGLLREFVLRGLSPEEFKREKEAAIPADADPKKGLTRDDLTCFCKERMGGSWQKAYIPNERLAMQVLRAGTSRHERDLAIRELVAEQNNPIVRHRLSIFAARLHQLEQLTKKQIPLFQAPDFVALEFVRDNLPESFLGQQAQADYGQWSRERKKEAKEALEIVKQLGCKSRDSVQKYLLLRSQGFQCVYFPNGLLDVEATKAQLADSTCIYTQQQIGIANLDDLVIDHIVPQQGGYNGPDAIVNKVITTRHVNEQMKKCRTPFEWFQQDMPGMWAAYVARVNSLKGTLGKKKARLLTQAEAPELVQKYTALAETAWISKLAQAILCIHFGWPFALDEERRRKITVISGGLTGRVRRAYDLNRILNPSAKSSEEAEKKNRADDRHHALDAMVISFIPNWARNAQKESFFRFPQPIHKNAKGFFANEIATVIPQSLCFEKAALAETIYGARGTGDEKVIVHRVDLLKLALKPVAPGKTNFDLDYLRDQTKKIRDARIQELLTQFHATEPDEIEWKNFCETFCLPRKDGAPGTRVLSLLMNVGDTKEYKDLSKDGSGAYRKALKGHKGQLVYVQSNTDKKGTTKQSAQVRPVYAFESQAKVSAELAANFGSSIRIIGFFQSGCLVQVDKQVAHPKQPLPPGKYRLNSIRTDSRDVKVTTSDGKTHPDIPRYNLGNMVAAGLRRADESL